jgi:hypothetical protein
MPMIPSPSAVARIAATALFGMYLALPLPTAAQDAAPKPPTAAEKLGAQPIASKEEEQRRLRDQQRQIDEARKKDIYNQQQRDADLSQQRMRDEKRQRDLKDQQKQAEFEKRAKQRQAEEDKKLRATRNDPNRDQAARDRRAKELRDERTINRELKKGPPQVQPLPADEAQRRTRDQQRQDDEARRKLEAERKKRGQG